MESMLDFSKTPEFIKFLIFLQKNVRKINHTYAGSFSKAFSFVNGNRKYPVPIFLYEKRAPSGALLFYVDNKVNINQTEVMQFLL